MEMEPAAPAATVMTRESLLLSRFDEVTAWVKSSQFTSDAGRLRRVVQGRVPVRHHDDEVRSRRERRIDREQPGIPVGAAAQVVVDVSDRVRASAVDGPPRTLM